MELKFNPSSVVPLIAEGWYQWFRWSWVVDEHPVWLFPVAAEHVVEVHFQNGLL